jgi:hypothetical protein
MFSRAIVLFLAVLAFHAGDARAELYKCVAKDGKVSYQGEPCTEAANEQRLREQAGGDPASASPPASAPKPASASNASKESWGAEQSNAIKSDCSKDAFANVQKGWGSNPTAFPEAEARDAVDKYCSCITRRITTSITPSQFAQNRFDSVARFVSEAQKGGECKMEIAVQ